MEVIVESNFLLELAFAQQEVAFCETMLRAAATGEISLSLPVYCLTEVFQTLGSRRQQRIDTERIVRQEIQQHLRETGVVAEDMRQLGNLLQGLLVTRTETQTARLFAVTQQLAQVARLLPLTNEVLLAAQSAQQRHSLTPQDALVLASLLVDNGAVGGDRVFVSRNESDFNKPELLAELRERNCGYLSSFRAAVGRLRL